MVTLRSESADIVPALGRLAQERKQLRPQWTHHAPL